MNSSDREQIWPEVNSETPCPICKKDHWCLLSPDGKSAVCNRVESNKPAKLGWFHDLDEPISVATLKPKKKKPRPDIDWTRRAMQMFTCPAATELRESLSDQLGVSVDSLERLHVGWGWDELRKVRFSSWPERCATGGVLGIIRRYDDGSKKTMKWSKHGIYYEDDWNSYEGPIYIPEGGSDTAALISLNLCSVGRPMALCKPDQFAALLSGSDKAICVIGERDEKPEKRGTVPRCRKNCKGCLVCWPGMYGAKKFAKNLANKLKRKVHWCLLPGAKDARDWLNKNPTCFAFDFIEVTRKSVSKNR